MNGASLLWSTSCDSGSDTDGNPISKVASHFLKLQLQRIGDIDVFKNLR
jgi:hypothetical protein